MFIQNTFPTYLYLSHSFMLIIPPYITYTSVHSLNFHLDLTSIQILFQVNSYFLYNWIHNIKLFTVAKTLYQIYRKLKAVSNCTKLCSFFYFCLHLCYCLQKYQDGLFHLLPNQFLPLHYLESKGARVPLCFKFML